MHLQKDEGLRERVSQYACVLFLQSVREDSAYSPSAFGSRAITAQERTGSQKDSGAFRLGLRYLSGNISVMRNFGKLKTRPSVFRDLTPPTSQIQEWPLRHILVKEIWTRVDGAP